MAAPAIILANGQILVTPGSSSLGIIPVDINIRFGQVAIVNSLCDKFAANDYVMFDVTKALSIMYGSSVYYLLNENDVSCTETPLP